LIFSTIGWINFISRVDLLPNNDWRILLKFIVYLFFIIIRNIGVKEVKELRQMLLC